MSDHVALRLDDVGAASKRHEIYGVTRVAMGRWTLPFPGNFLFLKYVPPIRRWGPYRELGAAQWESMLLALEATDSRMTVAVTAGWVERDGRIVPFPAKFPDAAAMLREGVGAGRLEIANHGYTHCLLAGGAFRPRLFSGNRQFHREFYDWLPETIHRDHLRRAQGILQEFFGRRVLTLVPPGNLLSPKTVSAAIEADLRYLSCRNAQAWNGMGGLTAVDDVRVTAIHDRDVVRSGVEWFHDLTRAAPAGRFVTVRDLVEPGAP
jgi:hypothetical protein